jgi:hypothetical protein
LFSLLARLPSQWLPGPAANLEAYTDWLGIGAALLSTIIAVIVTLLGGAYQLTTSMPRRSTART